MKMLHKVSVAGVLLALALTFSIVWRTKAASTVGLGTADNFAILAGSTVTNTGSSVINGDLGLSPGTSITGFPPGTVNGTQHVADAGAAQAQSDLTTAYNNAAGQGSTGAISADLAGQTLTPGVYTSASSIGLSGEVTLDGGGDADAVFIFQAGSTLTTGSGSSVTLINGAQACNVFWQVGSSATLGTSTSFKGNILALTSATLNNAANVEGRVLARNGAVTLDNNVINKATCAGAPPAPTVVPTATGGSSSSSDSSSGSSAGGGGSGGDALELPIINITKVPAPLALPAGPGSVTYTYRVKNIGPVAMSKVGVKDNKCTPVTYVSGDKNKNSLLEIDETWVYRCTTTMAKTTTNTATAHGFANGFTVYDTANATVVVGVPLPPPLINLVKKPSVFAMSAAGGAVTYTYTVTNPGTAPLHTVSVTDDKCTGLPGRVSGSVGGDINKNNLLESNETWTFTCQTKLTKTTTNTGTAEGHANGLTAIDFSLATVVVGSPGLPNTGIGMGTNNYELWIIILTAVIVVALVVFYIARKKRVA